MLTNVKRFLKDFLPGKGTHYFWGLFFLSLTAFFSTLVPIYIGKGIDLIEKNGTAFTKEYSHLNSIALTLITCGIIVAICRVLSRVFIFIPGRIIEKEIRQKLYESSLGLTPENMQNFQSGDLISRCTSDVTGVRVMISMGILHTTNSALMLLFCFYHLIQLNTFLTIICLIPIPFIIIALKFITHRLMMGYRKVQKQLGVLSETTREHLKAHNLMTIFPVFDMLFDKFIKENDNYQKECEAVISYRVMMVLVVTSASALGTFFLMRIGGVNVINSQFSLGDFMAFYMFIGMLEGPLRSAGFIISLIQRGEICLARIYKVIDTCKNGQQLQEARKIQKGSDFHTNESAPLVEIKNLNFSYLVNEENPTSKAFRLQIKNLKIEAGKKYGIFGPTGSGKTTLLKLLSSNYTTHDECLYFAGNQYNDFNSKYLLSYFSVVAQQNRHFSRSLKDNICMISENNPEDPDSPLQKNVCSFEAAYDISQLKNDIEGFNKGLETVVGEYGLSLSGGQKQRLGIMRALVKPRSLLLLDDFISAVDHDTEHKIVKKLYENLKDETVVFISHRISALIPCDEIIVIEDGKITAQASHQELLKTNELYKRVYHYQVIESEMEKLND